MGLDVLAFSALNGILYGMLLFLLASGLTLIFSMMGVLNFAHASFFMLGAYLGYAIAQWVGFFPALIAAPLAVGLLGALVERYALRRVHRFGHLSELLLTIGIAFVIHEAVQMIWGRAPLAFDVPKSLDFTAFEMMGTGYPAFRIFILVVSVAVFALLALVLSSTRVGLIVKASLTHPEMVSMLGHDVPFVFMAVFGVGAALAGLGGVIAGPLLITQPAMADMIGPLLFVIVVVGGLGSLSGAFIAALLIGFIQTFAVAVDLNVADVFGLIGVTAPPRLLGPLVSDIWNVSVAQIGPVIPYLLLIVVLLFRPMGLVGKRA